MIVFDGKGQGLANRSRMFETVGVSDMLVAKQRLLGEESKLTIFVDPRSSA